MKVLRKTVLVPILCILLFYSNISYAAPDNELLEYYRAYYDKNEICDVYLVNKTSDYSSYTFVTEAKDRGNISIITGSPIDVSADSISEKSEECTLSSLYMKKTKTQVITINFLSDDHEANVDFTYDLYQKLKKEYDVISAFVSVDGKSSSNDNRIYWDTLYRNDEFGIESELYDEFTDEQITALNKEISDNGFNATIDNNTGKCLFTESASETDKFKFAIWIKEKHGFSFKTISGSSPAIKYQIKVLHYTDMVGDVNNDNQIKVNDLVMLRQYILGNNIESYVSFTSELTCFNWKNADLCKDETIDLYDEILLRRLLINQNT